MNLHCNKSLLKVSTSLKYAERYERSPENSGQPVRLSGLPVFCFWLAFLHKVRRDNVFLVSAGELHIRTDSASGFNLTSFLFSLARQSEQLFWWKIWFIEENSGRKILQQAKKIAKGLRLLKVIIMERQLSLFINPILY